MKYELETIPVWDAVREEAECPFCLLEEKSRSRYLDFYLGSSVMNPETRQRVNCSGFCPSHFADLVARRKAHGLGLMTHTYLLERQKDLFPLMDALQKKSRAAGTKKVLPLVPGDVKKAQEELIASIGSQEASCLICGDISRSMKRYYYTLAYLWRRDEDFQKALSRSKGFCLHHMAGFLPLASEALKPSELARFLDELMSLQKRNLERMEGELRWFTQKFDSQNNDKPWGDSVNAHKRTVQKLTGRLFELD
jgi:hypothetical protein